MKKLAGLIVFIVLTYAVYNDLSIGTLPASNTQNLEISESAQKENIEKADRQNQLEIPYFEHEVKPGDTVLSVLDSNSDTPLNVPVTQAVDDFKKLNDGTDPQKIKFGHTYKFPDYSHQN
jgi:hypothetical protein